MKNLKKLIKHIISIAIMATAIIALVIVYNKYNYNDFTKTVKERSYTIFSRDSEVKCSEMDSYKIENEEYNSAMFYETISVTPNTPYKVTCKVKIENVENKNNTKDGRSIYMYCKNYRAFSNIKWNSRLARSYFSI